MPCNRAGMPRRHPVSQRISPRQRRKVEVDADVSAPTLLRFLTGGERQMHPATVTRIRGALLANGFKDLAELPASPAA